MLAKLTSKLWYKDPGFLRLKHASKTVMAVLLAIIVAYLLRIPALGVFVAGFAAGFLMQAVAGERRRYQQKTFVVICLVAIVLFFIGNIMQHNTYWQSGYLIILSFFAVYVRRYGPHFMLATLNLWVMGFIATILPGGWPDALYNSYGVVIASIIAFIVFFYIFPQRKIIAVFDNLRRNFNIVHKILLLSVKQLQVPESSIEHDKKVLGLMTEYREVYALNQNLLATLSVISQDLNAMLAKLVMRQFITGKAMWMIRQNIKDFKQVEEAFPQVIYQYIDDAIFCLAHISQFLSHKKYNANKLQHDISRAEEKLKLLQAALFNDKIIHKEHVVILLNITFSMQRMLSMLTLFHEDFS